MWLSVLVMIMVVEGQIAFGSPPHRWTEETEQREGKDCFPSDCLCHDSQECSPYLANENTLKGTCFIC